MVFQPLTVWPDGVFGFSARFHCLAQFPHYGALDLLQRLSYYRSHEEDALRARLWPQVLVCRWFTRPCVRRFCAGGQSISTVPVSFLTMSSSLSVVYRHFYLRIRTFCSANHTLRGCLYSRPCRHTVTVITHQQLSPHETHFGTESMGSLPDTSFHLRTCTHPQHTQSGY